MKTIFKIILIPLMVAFIIFACSKDDDTSSPVAIPAASLSSISPESGIKEVEVTLVGENFGTDKSKVKVFFNTTEAVVQSVTNTQIKTVAPSNGSSGAIKIVVNGKTVSGPVITYLEPTLSSITPESAQQGAKITFIGSNFGTDASKIKVFFTDRSMNNPNEIEAVVESVSNTEVVVVVPEQAVTGNVRMEVDGSKLAGPEFTLLELTLTDYIPKSGPVGTEVTLIGNTFGTDATKIQVFFNDIEATIQSLTDTEIKVLVPEGATTGDLDIITENDGLGVPFTVLPEIVSISPESGIKESVVTINGSSFGTNITSVEVFFNGKQAEVLTVENNKITTTVPPKAFTGLIKVFVDGTELTGPEFVYIVSEIGVSTIAGSSIGYKDGIGSAAQFRSPQGIEVDEVGNLYVADTENHILRKITPNGDVTTLAGFGGESGEKDGTGAEARFMGVNDIAFTAAGDMLVTDSNTHKIKRVTTAGVVTTFAGSGLNGSDNGPALSATFQQTSGVAIDSQGNVYVVEIDKHNIRKISASGEVSLFAGGTQAGTTDGNGTNARFNRPFGIAVDTKDNLYVTTDSGTHLIRKITPNGDVTTIAGSTKGFADGQESVAQFFYPTGIAVDKQGDIYVTDENNNRIRKISSEGNVTTLAGDGTTAIFSSPEGIAVDANGDLFIADRSNYRIVKITQE
ncbi:IPT/TIG domain-containing protein [Yeosuana marina]|uniref:IPT/TIG domain-containing protein n=1 Tax=Yeosuana marina TaxID=1565536 RepID=UPI0014213187|nr:IPT/TIG domain-containing protein [Yeosuana marina]